jgi:hypothetical protein
MDGVWSLNNSKLDAHGHWWSNLETNDTKDRSASDINIHLEIDSDDWLKKNISPLWELNDRPILTLLLKFEFHCSRRVSFFLTAERRKIIQNTMHVLTISIIGFVLRLIFTANTTILTWIGKIINGTCETSPECEETLICIHGNCQCSADSFWNGNQCVLSKYK